MSFNKTNIVKNITKKSEVSVGEASNILESFLLLIKNKSKLKSVKLSRFGSFSYKKTPKRLGRNPKTKVSYIIAKLNKLNFKPSNKIKDIIN
ncbi:HU family DNA-binding protein [Gammaproteobacteria bacterium]|nr:HU family DNA-binding protein [Gammaproteobacteria bacterium]